MKMEIVALIGKGRWNLTCFVYLMHEINSKVLVLSIYFIIKRSWIWTNTFSLGRCVVFLGIVLD
jgi:hypothetical protein